jgi:23S rRNA pseudouridine1911/1915/1917 synthase
MTRPTTLTDQNTVKAEADRHEVHNDDIIVNAEHSNVRLDRYLALQLKGISRSRVHALIVSGQATVNAVVSNDPGYRVKPGDAVSLVVPPPAPAEPQAETIELNVVFEDNALIVIDKPAGLVVHPAAGHETGTLVNALIAHCGESLSGIGGVKRPGIVHRLDKDTSGLLVVAKTDAAHQGLSEQFAAHGRDGRLEREYVALVWGALPSATGTIDAPLARSSQNRTKMAVLPKEGRARIVLGGGIAFEDGEDEQPGRPGREAITHYHVTEVFRTELRGGKPGAPLASLIAVQLETGRTHQIRVHMAHMGHPVLGDATYGAGFKASERRLTEPQTTALRQLGRQALHAAVLGFEHPITGEPMSFESEIPADMTAVIDALRGSPKAAAVPRRLSRRTR